MIHLTLDTKICTSKLFLNTTFDNFSFIEGEIITFNKFSIDGRLKKDFFDEVPTEEYASFGMLKDYCFSLIKGKRTPLSFKFIFALSTEQVDTLISNYSLPYTLQDIQGLYLNFRYDGKVLSCITGTSMHLFTLDKSLEQSLDTWVHHFFHEQEIPFESE